MKKIKLYYMRGRGRLDATQKNFGDFLSPLIVAAVSGRPVEYTPVKHADLLAIGSIISRANKARKFGFIRRPLHIWGSGAGNDTVLEPVSHFVHAVRGPLTLAKIPLGAKEKISFGDPGLLADLIVKKSIIKKHFLGLVPHYVDKENSLFRQLQEMYPKAKVIDVFADVKTVLSEISECDFIFSSSLHGMIVADAYGVPNKRVKCDLFLEDYKYKDYLLSHGIENFNWIERIEQVNTGFFEKEISTYARPLLDSLKQGLVQSFPYGI